MARVPQNRKEALEEKGPAARAPHGEEKRSATMDLERAKDSGEEGATVNHRRRSPLPQPRRKRPDREWPRMENALWVELPGNRRGSRASCGFTGAHW